MGSSDVTRREVVGVVEIVDVSGNTLLVIDGPLRKVLIPSGTALKVAGLELSTTELGLLDGATAGSITAGKVVTRSSASGIPQSTATPVADGSDETDGVALTADYNAVTGADGTKGAVLPAPVAGTVIVVVNTVAAFGLPVYPGGSGIQINALTAETGAFTIGPGRAAIFVGRSATQWYTPGDGAVTALTAAINALAQGVAAGYVVARGVGAVTGTLTVATGLATVVAVIATAQDDLDGDALAGVSATIGDQSGSPVAGSVILKAWKVTTGGAAGNPTLVEATDAKNVNWVAIGV